MAPYSVSKAGIETLVRNAADELGRAGVRVNAVRPGLVPTELADPLVSDEQVQADYLAQMPLHRLGTVDDIAAGVRYLLGPESSWVTGQILAIDGGHTLRRGPDIEHWARAMYGDAVVDVRAESGLRLRRSGVWSDAKRTVTSSSSVPRTMPTRTSSGAPSSASNRSSALDSGVPLTLTSRSPWRMPAAAAARVVLDDANQEAVALVEADGAAQRA